MTGAAQLSVILGCISPAATQEKQASAVGASQLLQASLRQAGIAKEAGIFGMARSALPALWRGARRVVGGVARPAMKLAPRAESAGANLMFRGATTGAPNFAANAVGRVGQFLREPGARALRGIGAWGERQIAGAQASGRVAAAVKRMNMMARQAEANRVAGAAVGKSMQQAARGKTWFRPGAGGFFGNSRLSKTLNIGNAAAAASLPAVIADRKRELDNVGDYAAAKAVYAIQKKPWHARLAMGFAPELTAQELAKTNPQAANYLRYLQSQEPQSRFGDFLNILKPSS